MSVLFTYTRKLIREKGKFWEELIVYFLSIRHGGYRKRYTQQFFDFCVRIRCRGNIFVESLSTNESWYTYRHTDEREGFINYAGAMICIPSLIKFGSGIQKLIEGYRNTQTIWWTHKTKHRGFSPQANCIYCATDRPL
jgi:hypothetical protein